MDFFTFDKTSGNIVENYNSTGSIYSKIIKTEKPANIGFMYIEPNGNVGFHQAPVPQLFLVVQGEGWVTGQDKVRIPIKSGEGVFWELGEGHESGSDSGMTALIIQSESLTLNLDKLKN